MLTFFQLDELVLGEWVGQKYLVEVEGKLLLFVNFSLRICATARVVISVLLIRILPVWFTRPLILERISLGQFH